MDQEIQISRAVDTIPPLPGTVEDLLAMTCGRDCSSMELTEALGRDPMFSLKLLRLVNSPFCGMDEEAASLQRAAIFVGTDTLKNLAIGLGAVGTFPSRTVGTLDPGEFWAHSLATGVCAQILAVRLGGSYEESTEYFLAGLLHDIGKLVYGFSFGEKFSRALNMALEPGCALADAEEEVLGLSHSEVGYMLAKRWNLPEAVMEAIRYHHVPAASSGNTLVQYVHAANEIVKKFAFGSAGNFEVQQFSPAVEECLGGTLDEMVDRMDDLDAAFDRARIFIKLAEAGA